MKNGQAQKVNKRLGVNILNENYIHGLKVNFFTTKQIDDLMIDDLIDKKTKQATPRLVKFIREILY